MYFVCVRLLLNISQLSQPRAGFIFLLLIGPNDTSVPSELPPHCTAVAVFSTLSFPMKHNPGCYWGCLCAFFCCNPLHLCTGHPSFGPGAITPYTLTIWPPETRLENKRRRCLQHLSCDSHIHCILTASEFEHIFIAKKINKIQF